MAKVRTAAEVLLTAELTDTQERTGTTIENLRVCDFAGASLAALFPSKYKFNMDAGAKTRERQRLVCLNVWRTEHGQDLLPVPPEYRIKPANEEVVLPALRTLATTDDGSARRLAEDTLLRLGPSAIAPLRTYANMLPVDAPGRRRLEEIEKLLACTVMETAIDGAEIGDDARKQMQAHLDTLKGRPLTTVAFVDLTTDLAKDLPQGVSGFEAKAKRDEDFAGILITLTVDGKGSSPGTDSIRQPSERVVLNNVGFYTTENSRGPELAKLFTLSKSFAHAADQALDAPPERPFLLSIFVNGK